MAYRFNGSSDYVRFAPTPLNAYVIGPVTMAALFKRSNVSGDDYAIALTDSGVTGWRAVLDPQTNVLAMTVNLTSRGAFSTLGDTTKWFLGAATWGGTGGTTARMHVHDGTSWAHADTALNMASPFGTVAGTDIFTVGGITLGGAQCFAGDIVCAGIKKASSSDLTVETLSPTSFPSWLSFGFDWLIGFDGSGTRNDLASPGTGGEVSRSGTSLVE